MFLEPFLGSLGIAIGGIITIPIVGKMWGVKITFRQGLGMGITFFVLRFLYLLFLRHVFGNAQCA